MRKLCSSLKRLLRFGVAIKDGGAPLHNHMDKVSESKSLQYFCGIFTVVVALAPLKKELA